MSSAGLNKLLQFHYLPFISIYFLMQSSNQSNLHTALNHNTNKSVSTESIKKHKICCFTSTTYTNLNKILSMSLQRISARVSKIYRQTFIHLRDKTSSKVQLCLTTKNNLYSLQYIIYNYIQDDQGATWFPLHCKYILKV